MDPPVPLPEIDPATDPTVGSGTDVSWTWNSKQEKKKKENDSAQCIVCSTHTVSDTENYLIKRCKSRSMTLLYTDANKQ